MKKLNKLQINPEKIIKSEELINLKGGNWYRCACGGYSNIFNVEADSIDQALVILSYVCPGSGSCFE